MAMELKKIIITTKSVSESYQPIKFCCADCEEAWNGQIRNFCSFCGQPIVVTETEEKEVIHPLKLSRGVF